MQAVKLIGSSPLITNYIYTVSFFNLNSIYAQSLRWRKPIWLPTAKSKVYRVPVKPKIPEDEAKEMQTLFNNYRTYMKSVRAFLREQNELKKIQLDQSVLDKIEEKDYEKCMKINDEWNKKIAVEREIRLAKEKEAKILRVLEKKEEKKLKEQIIKKEIEIKVRKAKIESTTFITKENIDQAIEHALEEIVDHNKALNPDGSWYTDNTGLLPLTAKETEKIQRKE